MKIAIVTQSYYPKPGGVTEVVHHCAGELRKRGHRVTIVTTSYTGKEDPQPGVVRIGRNVLLPVNGAWVNMTVGFGLKSKLEHIFREGDFDLIQTHCPLVPTLPLLTLKAAQQGQKIVGTFHAAAERNVAYRIFNRSLRKRADTLDYRIAVSRSACRFASSYFPGTYAIVPNGIDCTRFDPGVAPIPKLRDGKLNILYVGRMDKRKGLPYLFHALPLAQRKWGGKIRLLLVGEGTIRRFLIPRPMKLGGAEILTVGRVEPDLLPRYFTSADIFCSPATGQESFGIILLEAMASGVPVIASDIPGYRDVVSHSREGLLVRSQSPRAIAEAIVELASNPQRRAELGRRGREKALTYDWPIIVDRLEEIFHKVIGRTVQQAMPEQIHQSVR